MSSIETGFVYVMIIQIIITIIFVVTAGSK